MRNRFDKQLEQLNIMLIQMGSLIEMAINGAVNGLINQDQDQAKKAAMAEREVDHKEREIPLSEIAFTAAAGGPRPAAYFCSTENDH
jgi:phosphate uptake regulator